MFEDCQKELQLPIRSLKRNNTVRWSAREYCLDMFLKRYHANIPMLRKIVADTSFHPDKKDIADGLLDLFSTKQFIASAYLFREIFAITGPLSRILQSVNIDFGKALNLLDATLEQLTQLRDNPQSVIDAVEKDFAEIERKEKRTGRKRRMPGELAEDEPATLAEDKWRREVFYVAVDSVLTGITNRFSSSSMFLKPLLYFHPKHFRRF